MSAPTRAQQLIDVLLHAPRAMAKAGGCIQLAIVVLLVLATRALPSFSTATTNQVIADA